MTWRLRLVGAACTLLAGLLALVVSMFIALPLLTLTLWHLCVVASGVRSQRTRDKLVWEVGAWAPDPVAAMATIEQVMRLPARQRRQMLRSLQLGQLPVDDVSSNTADAFRKALSARQDL